VIGDLRMATLSNEKPMNPVTKLALWVLAVDIAVAAVMLVILKEPVPVLVTFAIVYIASFVSLRGVMSKAPRTR
jgi:hypothetical protein